jgi:hypothetical protein
MICSDRETLARMRAITRRPVGRQYLEREAPIGRFKLLIIGVIS